MDLDGTYHLIENQNVDLGRLKERKIIFGSSDQVSNADIYQVIAYTTHKDICASSAALVYPVSSEQQISELPYYAGLGFFNNEQSGIPVYILTIRVDRKGIISEVNGKGLLKKINQILINQMPKNAIS